MLFTVLFSFLGLYVSWNSFKFNSPISRTLRLLEIGFWSQCSLLTLTQDHWATNARLISSSLHMFSNSRCLTFLHGARVYAQNIAFNKKKSPWNFKVGSWKVLEYLVWKSARILSLNSQANSSAANHLFNCHSRRYVRISILIVLLLTIILTSVHLPLSGIQKITSSSIQN